MAKSASTSRKRTGTQAPAQPASPGADGTPESLDKVRDILFGGQMRMVESRLKGLEERLAAEQRTLRADFTKRVDDLEGALRRELAQLTDKLAAERAKRAEELKALGSDFKEALKGLERRHLKLEEAASLADAELRDQILTQTSALSAELGRVHDQLAADLDAKAQALQNEKVDISALVGLLNDLAGKLGGGRATSGKGAGRG